MTLLTTGNLLDFDHLVDDFWAPRVVKNSRKNSFFAPNVDIVEHDEHYLILAEMPGITKENIDITLENGVLTLKAERKQEAQEASEGKVIRQERRLGKYMRSFNLGSDILEDGIDAVLSDGVLTLTVPKVPEEVPKQRRIDIQ